GSVDGPAVYTAPNTSWSETGITWNHRPARSTTPLDDLGAIPNNTWVELDVTDAITRNGTDTFVLASSSTDRAEFASRETDTAPQLVITTTDPITPIASQTPTPTATQPSTGAITFIPTADADARADQPTTNFGTNTVMIADTSGPNAVPY